MAEMSESLVRPGRGEVRRHPLTPPLVAAFAALTLAAVAGTWAVVRLLEGSPDSRPLPVLAVSLAGAAAICGVLAVASAAVRARTMASDLAMTRRILDALAGTTHDWLWSTDVAGVVTYTNDAVLALLGYRPDEVLGMQALDLMDREYAPTWAAEVRAFTKARRGWYDVTQRLRHKDGSIRTVECSAQPIIDRRGMVLGYEGAIRPISADRMRAVRAAEIRERVERVLAEQALDIAFQPIVSLSNGRVVGVEALARFGSEPYQPPEAWFTQAAEVGLTVSLELLALRRALEAVPQLDPSLYISINASPRTVGDPAFLDLLLAGDTPLNRLVLEITEHESIEDYQPLANVLGYARSLGLRLAVDDAGAGYASFRHIVKLRPDHIKLDRDLTAGIDRDPARRALASAVVVFALELDASVTAEGVETEDELDTLRSLSVDAAQGYYLARPATDPAEWRRWPARPLQVVLGGRAHLDTA